QTTIAAKSVQAAMILAAQEKEPEFILSGGEPLLAWRTTFGILTKIRQKYESSYLSVQSNVTLLDASKTAGLKKMGANIEIGIDGDENTTLANRPGAEDYYPQVRRALESLSQSGIPTTTTMTVYPHGAAKLSANLEHIAKLGARNVEVHPAFLETWDARTSKQFLQEYRKASVEELRGRRRGLICRDYSLPVRGAWDMVILPNGKVLPNWTFLSFAEKVRRSFYIMELASGRPIFLPQAEEYFDKLAHFIAGHRSKQVSYRAVSNYNAGLAAREQGRPIKGLTAYIDLCQKIEEIDWQILKRRE
ncbi:MAG: hypothetical protein HGA80_08255, partial [Candidatus Omnitrophica bacterium]|nr:hypothetical protein [Candidatus Omnitrophota bacterium]